MIGRTNVGGNAPASLWYAYIQVSTDANAVITAVNPAGNSYTKTADENGSAIFIVAYPGTYTISETGATSQTVVVADYGVAYSVSIHVPEPAGYYLIKNGNPQESFTRAGAVPSSYSVQHEQPFISTGITKANPITGNMENWVLFQLESSNAGGYYGAVNSVDLTGYTKLYINMFYNQNYANLYFGVFYSISGGWINVVTDKMASYQSGGISTVLNLPSTTNSYYIGMYGINDSSHSNTNAYIKDLYLA